MRYFDLDIHDLGERDLAAWRAFAAPGGRLSSPYLLPEFAQAVAQAREDVRVLVAEENGAPCAFFAYHAGPVARPVGAPMSDYQGVVARSGTAIEPDALLTAMKAGALVYENWAGTPAPGRVRQREGSAIIDLEGGVQEWLQRRHALHRNHFRKIAQRARRAEREYGPARIVIGDAAGAHFEMLKAWKAAQYRETGKLDLFAIPWVATVLAGLAARRFGPLRGLTSALYYGDRLAAVEFGLAAGGVYHSWFPAYDPAFAPVSPGLQLLHGLVEAAPRLSISRIDLGKGESHYKKYYGDYEVPLSQGRVLASSLAAAGIAGWDFAESIAARLPRPLADAPARLRRRWAQTSAFEPDLRRRLMLMRQAVGDQLGATRRA